MVIHQLKQAQMATKSQHDNCVQDRGGDALTWAGTRMAINNNAANRHDGTVMVWHPKMGSGPDYILA